MDGIALLESTKELGNAIDDGALMGDAVCECYTMVLSISLC